MKALELVKHFLSAQLDDVDANCEKLDACANG